MAVSEAAALYASGLTLREVGAQLGGYDPRSVSLQLERAGIPRRRWDPRTGGASYRPRVELRCDSCGRPFTRREYYHAVGIGTRSAPNAPESRYCSPSCLAWGLRRIAIERARNTIVVDISDR